MGAPEIRSEEQKYEDIPSFKNERKRPGRPMMFMGLDWSSQMRGCPGSRKV